MRKFLIPILLFSTTLLSAKDVSYSTSFGRCPSRVVGALAFNMMKEFEATNSLYRVKEFIQKQNVTTKYFLSDLNVNYSPAKNKLSFSFKCPEPVMKVQIYKNDGNEHYTAVLGDNGELLDPTYEVLLKAEKKLRYDLPFLALPVAELDRNIQKELASVMAQVDINFRKHISEVILDAKNELTITMSINGKTSNAFLGKENFKEKIIKLSELISYLKTKEKIPTQINITNAKKVVVKFSEAI